MNKKAVSFADFPINLLWIGIFVIAIITFAIGLGELYDIKSTDMIDKRINVTIFEEKLNQSSTKIGASKNATLDDELNTGQTVLNFESIWGTIKNAYFIITSMINVIASIFVGFFGIVGGGIIFTGVLSIIVLSLLFSIWRLISTGR